MIELLRRLGGKYRRYMVIGPACKLIEVIFDLLTPLVIAQMIDKGIGAHDVSAVVHYGMVLAAMAVIGISFTLVCQKMAALTSQGMGTDIRGALYKHINKLSYAELDRFGTPSLITRITNDVNQVQLAVALGVRMLIRWPFLAVGSMVAALAIDLFDLHARHRPGVLVCHGALHPVLQTAAGKARSHRAYLPRGTFGRPRGPGICARGSRAWAFCPGGR